MKVCHHKCMHVVPGQMEALGTASQKAVSTFTAGIDFVFDCCELSTCNNVWPKLKLHFGREGF